MKNEELDEWIEELLASDSDESTWRDHLQQALDENRELRDENFVHPETVLVFTEATGALDEVPLWDLALRYPLKQPGQRWSHSDLGEVVEAKAALYRQSKVANELAEENPAATPECGTVVLVDPDRPGALVWVTVRARVLPSK